MIMVCVPLDEVAIQVVTAIREMNQDGCIVVRCRYLENVAAIRKAGANDVVCEETHSAAKLMELAGQLVIRSEVGLPMKPS